MTKTVNNIKVQGRKGVENTVKNIPPPMGGDSKNGNKKDIQTTNLVKNTAEIMGVSTRFVRYVIGGERNNEQVFTCYMELLEGETKLIKEVKKLVPFNI